jgi:hypothetical protein
MPLSCWLSGDLNEIEFFRFRATKTSFVESKLRFRLNLNSGNNQWEETMSRKLQGLGLAALLALTLNAGAAHAQAAAEITKSTSPLGYDVSKEVTLSATVQSVPSKSSRGLTPESGPQSGFMLQTTAGTIRGRLTYSALNGEGALSITPGEHVQVTGMMVTMKNNTQVFVIRTIQVGGRAYTIRNERGFPVAHPALNTSTTTVSKGGQL